MKHDRQYLESEQIRLSDDMDLGSNAITSCIIVAEKYAEHVHRWRAIDDQPTDGERIELVDESGNGVVVFPNEIENPFIELWLMHDAIAWRSSPLGKLPESSDETR